MSADPELMSFRSAPCIITAIKNANSLTDISPDIVICNSYGIAHPSRVGTASHIGILLGKPSIGITKDIMCGELKENKDGTSDVLMQEEIYSFSDDEQAIMKKIGFWFDGKMYSPLVGKYYNKYYISPGHMMCVDKAYEVIKYIMKKKPKMCDIAVIEAEKFRGNDTCPT